MKIRAKVNSDMLRNGFTFRNDDPYVEIELDTLPSKGDDFYLTPDQDESLIRQYMACRQIDKEFLKHYMSEAQSLREFVENEVTNCSIVECNIFTYDTKTYERFIVILLKEDI